MKLALTALALSFAAITSAPAADQFLVCTRSSQVLTLVYEALPMENTVKVHTIELNQTFPGLGGLLVRQTIEGSKFCTDLSTTLKKLPKGVAFNCKGESIISEGEFEQTFVLTKGAYDVLRTVVFPEYGWECSR